MKIVYDHQVFTMQEYGGVSRYFVELAKQLGSRTDVELNLLAPLYFNRYLDDANLTTTIGVRVPKTPFPGKIAHFLNNLISHSWLKRHDPDILHATYYSPIKRKRGSKAKVVVTVHDMIHELYPDDFVTYDRTAQLKHEAVKIADHIICVSHNTRKDLIRLIGVDPNKVSVVHHGVNRIMVEKTTEIVAPGKPFLLFVGKRGGYKNFSGLLNVYASSNELNTRFSLVCFGGGRFTAKELAIQKHYGLCHDQVQWFGGSDAKLAELYKNAIAFIYPSLYEGFGIPPLEAMSFNCPIVCSNGGSIPEIVGDAGEFFDPQNTEDLLRAITWVVDDDLNAEKLRLKGTNQLKKYSWSKCAQETIKVYQSLV